MDGDGVQDAHGRGAALLALGQRLVGHPLDHVEDVAVLALVLVDRHGVRDYRSRYGSGMAADGAGGAPDRGLDGGDRRPLQAARLRLPLLGDLRRPRLDLRLRPLRRAAQEQRQGRVVAGDAAGARRHRRARLGDPPAPAGLGGLGPPRGLHRPARPVPRQVQEALARGPPARGGRSRRRRPERRAALPGVRRRALRAAPVQPDVRDPRRPGRRRGLGGLPAAGDGPGHLHQLQERARLRPQEAALRHRPDRQVLPQRDHPRQLHLPHPRVRADGDGVLRPARPTPSAGTGAGSRSASAGTPSSASAPTTCASAPTTPTSSPTTPRAPATSSTSSRSAGRSSRGSPTAATSTSPSTPSSAARSSSTSTSRPKSATSPT